MPPLLEVTNLEKYFPVKTGLLGRIKDYVRAVDRVSFHLNPGETLGLVGESGCGKTTVGRSILRLIEPSGGEIYFAGELITRINFEKLRKLRPKMQIIFQDPFSSLNPRRVVLDLVGEGLSEHKIVTNLSQKKELVVTFLEKVGLTSQMLYRYPHEFSGGQLQRIAIARGLTLNPQLIICDEVVSALDVSVQAQIINLLMELQKELQITYLFIAHDLAVVKHISQRVAVMYQGQIVELAPTNTLFNTPRHPYTQVLMEAILPPNPHMRNHRLLLNKEREKTLDYSKGCRFAASCPCRKDLCQEKEPPLLETAPGHYVRCFSDCLTDTSL